MNHDSVHYISNGGVQLGVIPEIGGTIVYLSKNNSPNLIKSNPDLWDITRKPKVTELTDFVSYCGHTVWLGPQKEWWTHQNILPNRRDEAADWPPDPYLYITEYSIIQESSTAIHLKGVHSPISGVTIEKEIAINPDGSIFIQATVQNTGNQSCAWDIWHNTRFDGTCCFSVSAQKENISVIPVLNEQSTEMPYVIENNTFSYCPQKPPQNFVERSSKAFVYPDEPEVTIQSNGHLVTIHFEKHPKAAIHPAQGLLELYNHTEHGNGNDLLEVEYHSPYKTLQIGESMSSWEVWTIE